MNDKNTIKYLTAPPFLSTETEKLAYRHNAGNGPTVIWCGGLKSDMDGSKATALHDWAEQSGQDFIRFDYYGHGQSSGRFRDGTISRWAADVGQVIDELASPKVVLIGSSMGGWTSLLTAIKMPERVKGLVLIAPAPDFTEKLTWANWSDEARRAVMEDGIYYEPSEYDEPYEYSRELILDGRDNQILDGGINFDGPVRILQGLADTVVPASYAQNVLDAISSPDVTLTLVKEGDHSLSRPEDIDRLIRTVKEVCREI